MKENDPLQIKSVKRKTLANQVIEQIIDLLLSEQLKAGDKLPSEMELMEMLHVSRPVLREALSSLEALGIINRKTKEGTFFSTKVGSEPFKIMLALSVGDIDNVIEIRLTHELGLVGLAAEKISELELKKLSENIEEMEQTNEDYTEIDREFHRIIAYSGSNSLTEGMIDPILNMYDKTLENIALKDRSKSKTVQQHKDIYHALLNRDPIEAYRSMYNHLDHVRDRIGRSVEDRRIN
ncbi:DNA-binding transcriptional regulator, FadR family [Marinococcus luteus]|uniref:DNA-binding transcriptional regulator, FadR family n=1 Tax=Marinococcus luteus TaxID=1122204 RepID=A0A1H2QTR8_9BACI|nr:FadR/GntR family transcriptional regulator [Marinococcus luteus]SDW10587.1 DNA-binding transcriptional regulator, FadR family [Marinococcus luteus]